MKKTITLFMSLLMFIILFGNLNVNAQISEMWNVTHSWNTDASYNARGIAYSDVTNHLYVAAGLWGQSTGDKQFIKVLDPSTGAVLGDLQFNTGWSDLGYGVHDVEVDSAGSIFATITTTNSWHPIKLIYWANEAAEPSILWSDASGDGLSHGPGFSVKGRFIDGNAVFILPHYYTNTVYYIESTDSVLGDVQTLTLADVPTGAKNINIEALGNRIADGFWYNCSTLDDPTIFDGNGNIVDALDNAAFIDTVDIAGVKQFSTGGKDYLTVGSVGNVYIFDVTGITDFSDVTLDDTVQVIAGIDPTPEWSTPAGYGQEEAIITFGCDGFEIISLSGDRYIKALITPVAPTASNLMFTGYAMLDSTLNFSYTFSDVNGDTEGATLIKWYLADDAIGTNITEITANAGLSSYVPVAADKGKYISVSVLPVDATGLSCDENLVETDPIEITDVAHKPIASNLAITGDPNVYSTLTASYTFYDEDGDEEGTSILKWWKADDAVGTNVVEIASGSLTYDIVPADTNKFIIFSVTPVSVSPNLSTGDSIAVATATAVVFPEFAPVASNVGISGMEEVTRVLTGTYTYSDLNEDPEGESVLTWYRADAIDGTKTPVSTDTNMYTLVTADEGKYIFFGVKPVSDNAVEGTEVFDTTGVIAPAPNEEPPIASDVIVHGDPEVGAMLTGTYTYFDYTDDLEGESIYKWYAADDAEGTNMTEITGADEQSYLVSEDYLGKYFIFEVTPVALTGGELIGLPVQDTSASAAIASTNTAGLERNWIGSTSNGALPWYLGTGSTERNLGIGNEHVYVASRKLGIDLLVLDKNDGSLVGKMNTEGMDVGLFKINDVEVSDDGQILACPLQLDASTEPFVVYKWTDENAAPTKFIEYTATEALRLGDKFTVTGDVSGDAVIWAAAGNNADGRAVRWIITDGVPDAGEVVTLSGFPVNLSLVTVSPLSTAADAKLLADGRGGNPTILNPDGTAVDTLSGVNSANYMSNTGRIFTYKGRTMAAFFQEIKVSPYGARAVIMDITSKPYQIVDSTLTISAGESGYLGDIAIYVDEDYYALSILHTNKGIGLYQGEMLLPEFVEGITSQDGTMLMADFTKSIDATTVSGIDAWTIMSGSTELNIASISSADVRISFTLSSPAIEGDVVTIAYDGTAGVASFDGMPLNPFGPVEVENVTGADIPVASNVTVTGTPRTNEVLTGTYDFADDDGDLEGVSTYQWLYSDNADGSNALILIGESNITYTVTSDMEGKYVAFEVTPVSASGGDDYLVGEPVKSEFVRIIPTSVENVVGTQLSIYPNPVNNTLNINRAENLSSITIYDITGRVVLNYVNTNESKIKLNVADFKSGIFIVQMIDSNGKTEMARIVKN